MRSSNSACSLSRPSVVIGYVFSSDISVFPFNLRVFPQNITKKAYHVVTFFAIDKLLNITNITVAMIVIARPDHKNGGV